MDLLRFATAGSVDDGKSTLIGRLLYDSKSIFEDQLSAVEESSRRRGDAVVNLALLTDGLLYPVLILPAASIVAALMAGAIVMHLKVADPFKKSLPSISLLALSLLMMVGRWGA